MAEKAQDGRHGGAHGGMTAEHFTVWLRGFMSAMHGRLGTPADVEAIRAELAKVMPPPVLSKQAPTPPMPFDSIQDALKRAADEVEKRKGAQDSIGKVWPQPGTTKWVGEPGTGCEVCGVGARGELMGYVCSNPRCPTRVTCGPTLTGTAYVGVAPTLMGTVQGSSIR